LFHIPGVDNWSNWLTKLETAEQLNSDAEIYQVLYKLHHDLQSSIRGGVMENTLPAVIVDTLGTYMS
jgi:hypothetical protein